MLRRRIRFGTRQIRALSWRQRVWLFEAALLNVVFRTVVKHRDVRAAERLAGRLGDVSLRAPRRRPDPADIGAAIRVAARLPLVRVLCVPRTLTAITMLARRGVAAQLHLGVASDGGEFAAHAWATVDGVDVISEPGDVGAFVELLSGPAGSGMLDPQTGAR